MRDKFPEPRADTDAIPTHADLPPQDWKTGEVGWGQGSEDALAERRATFRGKSVQLRLDSLKEVLAGLSKQKASGVDTRVLSAMSSCGGSSRTATRRRWSGYYSRACVRRGPCTLMHWPYSTQAD